MIGGEERYTSYNIQKQAYPYSTQRLIEVHLGSDLFLYMWYVYGFHSEEELINRPTPILTIDYIQKI